MDIFAESIPFRKGDQDIEHEAKKAPPQCILGLGANVKRNDLTNKEMRLASKELIRFRRERKFRVDPPIPGQSFAIISFIPSPTAVPDSEGCFGVFKVRGSFGSQLEAEQYAQVLLRKTDSLSTYDIIYVGHDAPLMADPTVYTKETTEVDLQANMDMITKGFMKTKKNEEKREKQLVEERHHKLLGKKDKPEEVLEEDTETDLERYTRLRTKRAYAQMRMDESMKHFKDAEKALEDANKEIAVEDEKHPNYKTEFLDKYDKALDKIDADKKQNPYLPYMKRDVESYRSEQQEEKKPINEQ